MTTPDPNESTVRVCRKCSVQSATAGEFCPNCGTSYVKRARVPRVNKRTGVVVGIILLILAASAGSVIAKSQHDKHVREDRAQAAAAHAAKEKKEAAERRAAQKAEADEAERKLRRVLITELEKNILKSAKKVAKTGYFDGPILSAQCTATGGGSSDDLTALTGTFDCLAVNKENGDGTVSGYGYEGTIDWDSGDLSWQPEN